MILELITSIAKFLGPLGKPLANWIERHQKAKIIKLRLEVLELKKAREGLKKEIHDAKGETRERLLDEYHYINSRIMYLQLLLRETD